MANCPRCGRSNDGEAAVCVGCGAEMVPGGRERTTLMPPGGGAVPAAGAPFVRKLFCPHCGAPLAPGVAFCGRCGNKAGE